MRVAGPHPSDPGRVLPAPKASLGIPVPARRGPSWPPSPDEDAGLPPFPREKPGPRPPVAPGPLPSAAASLEEDEDGAAGPGDAEELRSEEHPGLFFAEAQRLREQGLLLDQAVAVGGRMHEVHRVILAAVSGLFRDRLLEGEGSQPPWSLPVSPGAWEAVVTFAYTGVLVMGPASPGEVLQAAEALRAPRVKAAVQRRFDDQQLSQAEELRENLLGIQLLYQEGIGCDLELEADGCRLRGEDLLFPGA